ncbi:MAG TPA: MoaD/ThiS family protein [Candidatus Poseidoniales archaeon]|nr:MoaD/ThiS family protein [Candidatus Poseidoniales archaeon]
MVHILLFGPLAERIGWREMEQNISPSMTIERILSDLELTVEEMRTTTTMLDGRRCEMSEMLGHATELALLPPVSGG